MLTSGLSVLLLALASDAASPPAGAAAPTPEVVAELRAGVGAPLGPVGLAVSVALGRFSVGGGIGVADVRLHEAFFGRAALIQGRRLRLSLELGWSVGSDSQANTTIPGYQLSSTRGGSRYDASVVGEVGAGRAWLGLQAGIGHLDGKATCWQQDLATTVFMTCDPQSSPSPPSWLPFLALTLRPRAQAEAGDAGAPGPQPGATRGLELRAFLSGTRIERTDVFSDGHFDGDTAGSGSIGGELLSAKGTHFRYGLGLRYEVARVLDTYPSRGGYDHFVYAPVLVGVALPLAGANQIELMAGFGLGVGLVRGGSTTDGSDYMRVAGPTLEFAFTYWTRITRGLDLSLGVAAQASTLAIQNGATDYFRNASVLRGVFPLRAGVRWSL